jgi:hypothetical protein
MGLDGLDHRCGQSPLAMSACTRPVRPALITTR